MKSRSEGETMTLIDRTPAGPQHVLPGAERVGDGTLARRRADAPMRPSVPQTQPGGLFSDDARQLDICDLIRVADRR
jgi:hypothetical protein